MLDILMGQFKEKIKGYLMAKVADLEKHIQESPNKLDDTVWAFVKAAVHKWIDSL